MRMQKGRRKSEFPARFRRQDFQFPIIFLAEKGSRLVALKLGWKLEKGPLQKWMRQGFLSLGHSRWTTCSLLNLFCPIKFPPFCHASHNKPFLTTAGLNRTWRTQFKGFVIEEIELPTDNVLWKTSGNPTSPAAPARLNQCKQKSVSDDEICNVICLL